MRIVAITIVLFLLSSVFVDLEAKKKRKKAKRPKTSQKKRGEVLPDDQGVHKDLIYQKKYKKRNGAGAYFFMFREEGIPDDDEKIKKDYFIGIGFMGRIDLSDKVSLFPRLAYTAFKNSKVFTESTKDLSFAFIEVDGAYRYPIKGKSIEAFAGGGLHGYYRKLVVSYSTSSPRAGTSSTDDDFEIGCSAFGMMSVAIVEDLSFLFTGKFYLVNPDLTYSLHAGLMVTF